MRRTLPRPFVARLSRRVGVRSHPCVRRIGQTRGDCALCGTPIRGALRLARRVEVRAPLASGGWTKRVAVVPCALLNSGDYSHPCVRWMGQPHDGCAMYPTPICDLTSAVKTRGSQSASLRPADRPSARRLRHVPHAHLRRTSAGKTQGSQSAPCLRWMDKARGCCAMRPTHIHGALHPCRAARTEADANHSFHAINCARNTALIILRRTLP